MPPGHHCRAPPEPNLISHAAAIGGVPFQSITAYRKTRFDIYLDLDQTPRPLLAADTMARDSQFSQELQLSSRGGGKLTWVTGLFYFHANDRSDPGHLAFGPNSPLAPTPAPVPVPVDVFVRDRQLTDSIAGYAQATYEVLPATHLTLGARYTSETKTFTGKIDVLVAGTQVAGFHYPTPDTPARKTWNDFNYRVSLDHKFGRDFLAYASYNTGFKSGGYNTFLPSNPPYDPEKIGAAEIGLKTELFARRLRLNLAGYRYRYRNIQVGRFIDGNEAIFNAARASINGIDLDAELVVGHSLTLSGGFAYTDAKFTSFPNAGYVIPVGGCTPPQGGVCSADAKGNHLPFSPETTFNLGGDYKFDIGFGTLAIDANYFHTATFYANSDNVGYQPAYDLVNASIGWTDPGGHVSVKAWGKNLGKTIYATSLVEANQGLVRALGAPRTFGLTLSYKY